jgi:hypothetical protein
MSQIEKLDLATETLISASKLRAACGGISDMTLYRWLEREILPPPIYINGRRYWKKTVLRELQENGRAVA